MEKEYKEYLDNSVFLLRQVKLMLRNHNKMFALSAANGDLASSSALLNNNVAIASIETVLNMDIVSQAEDLSTKPLVGEEDLEEVLRKPN